MQNKFIADYSTQHEQEIWSTIHYTDPSNLGPYHHKQKCSIAAKIVSDNHDLQKRKLGI